MGTWAGVEYYSAGLRRQRIQPSLLHDFDDVAKESGLTNFAIRDAGKIDIGQKGHFSCRWDTEPGLIEKAHQVSHTAHPFTTINFTGTCHEDILTALDWPEGPAKRFPKHLRDSHRALLLIEGMHTPEEVIFGCIAAQNLRNFISRCLVEIVVEV